MNIRYLKDGISDVSDDEEVVCVGDSGYYIAVNIDSFKYIPFEYVISKFQANSSDVAPTMLDFLNEYEIEVMPKIDYSLTNIFAVEH